MGQISSIISKMIDVKIARPTEHWSRIFRTVITGMNKMSELV